MKPNQSPFAALFFVLFFCYASSTSASHSRGAEITYLHLVGNNYRLHLTFYRDCFGIPAPTVVTIQAVSISCGITNSYPLFPIPGTGQTMTHVCQTTFTTCDGGTETGVEKWEYEADVLLQANCSDWVFSFSDCCRIGTTILPNAFLYVESMLNNLSSDNNSPQFTNDPEQFTCSNELYHYNNGMIDPDGDSIAYRLIGAIGATYLPGYSGQQPFVSVPPVTFDSITGDYIMHPTGFEIGPVAFQILDYRNGILMGSVIRETSITISPCVNHNPSATGMNGTSQQFDYVLPGDTICFDILSDDTDAANTLTMTWNNSIPVATFTTAGTPHPTGTFCWTPSVNDLRAQPYMFTATITDDNCPATAANVYSYYIFVTLDSSLALSSTNAPGEYSTFAIHPNPSDGIFVISTSEKFSGIQIYNHLGECILKKDFDVMVDLSDQPGGIYFLEAITADGKSSRQKIIKAD